MKDQGKTPEEQLREVKIGYQPKREFRRNDGEGDPGPQKKNGAQIEKIQEIFSKELKNLKNREINSRKNEMKKYTRRNQ